MYSCEKRALLSPVDRRSGAAIASQPHVLLVLIFVSCTTGGNFTGFKVAVETIPPFLMIGTRLLAGGLLLLPIALFGNGRIFGSREPAGLSMRQLGATAIMAMLLLVLGQGMLVWSVQELSAGTAAVLTSSMPLWVALLSFVWFREPIARWGLIGIALGFTGLVLLAFVREGGESGEGSTSLLPTVVTLAGAAAGAVGVLFGRKADLPENELLGSALQMLAAGFVLASAGLAMGEAADFQLSQVSARSWAALGYLIVLGSAVGFAALVWLTKHAAPATASSFAYVGPVIALFLSAWLLDESLSAAKIVAAVLVLGGAALMVSYSDKSSDTPRSSSATER